MGSSITIAGITYGVSITSAISFYENGQVKVADLENDTTIDGVTYKKGVIFFYSNGQVKDGYLASNQTIDGITYSISITALISFYENGQVKAGTLAQNTNH